MNRTIGLITARGGSKGLPGKNVMMLCGRPLIGHTAADAVATLDRVFVSTDDAAIADAARDHGAEVPFMRPDVLSSDTATSGDVVLHAIDALELAQDDVLVLLQPTSPLRSKEDIEGGVALHAHSGDPVVAVTAFEKPLAWLRVIEDGVLRERFPGPGSSRRQDAERLYIPNGALYVASVAQWREGRGVLTSNTRALVMPRERSIDIDDALDFAIAEALMALKA